MANYYLIDRRSAIGASLTVAAFAAVLTFSTEVLAQGKLRERLRERLQERRQSDTTGSDDTRRIGPSGTLQEVKLKHDGRTRTYLAHLPKGYQGSGPMPVVLAFHGGGGSSQIMAKDEFYGWISKSDEKGFIVIFPNGTGPFRGGKFATWNAGSCCAYARDNNVDDVGFIRELIRDAKERFPIDEKRVFATGMSNGGMFSYTLACSMADVFTAIASVTGTDGNAQCSPQKPIAVLHIHAKDDTHVLFNGGAGKDAFKDLSKVTEFVSVPDTIGLWVKRNGCEENPRRVLNVDGAYCDLYENCQAGSQVKLCVTETGGHSWPGAKATPRKKSIPPSQAIDATDVIWDFFSSKTR